MEHPELYSHVIPCGYISPRKAVVIMNKGDTEGKSLSEIVSEAQGMLPRPDLYWTYNVQSVHMPVKGVPSERNWAYRIAFDVRGDNYEV